MYTIDKLNIIFSKEETLIILLCRLHFRKLERQEVLDFIAESNIDYQIFLSVISEHGIRPFMYHVLVENNISIDKMLEEKLKNFYISNQARSMELAVLCNSVQGELARKSIQVIPFKGPVFSFRYYGNIGLRESTDIDLLADTTDIEHVETYLQQSGGNVKLSVPREYLAYYKKYFKEIVYTIKSLSHSYSVEVHWILLNRYIGTYPAYQFFINGIRLEEINSLPYQVLEPDYDLIAVSSNHFVKDLCVRFKYLVDIGCLLHKKGSGMDITLIEKISEEYKCRKKLDYGFSLVAELLGIELKGWKYKHSFDENFVHDALAVPAVVKNFDVISLPFLKRSMIFQDNNYQRFVFLKRCVAYFFLPTNNDINSFKLPTAFLFLLALLRPFRLIGKQMRKSFGV